MLENKIRSLLKAYRAACRNSNHGYITATPSLIPFFGHLDALFSKKTPNNHSTIDVTHPISVSPTNETLQALSVEAVPNNHHQLDTSSGPASPNEVYITEHFTISPAGSPSPQPSVASQRSEEEPAAAAASEDDGDAADDPDEVPPPIEDDDSHEPCHKCRCSAKLTMRLHAKKLECMRQIAEAKERGRNQRFQAKMEGLKAIERNKDERAKRANALKMQMLASVLADKKRRHMERMEMEFS